MFEPLEEDVPSDLEDGEISDFEYTPLERPTNNAAPNNVKVPEPMPQSSSEDDNNDSDDDPIAKIKRQRIDLRGNSNPTSNPNKYKIWCQSLQDEALAENLGSCEVGEKSDWVEGRNVENYNYRLKYQDDEGQGLKRRHDGNNTGNASSATDLRHKLGRQPSQAGCEERIILPLKHNEDSSEQDLADDIANKLLEIESDLVLRTVQLAGKKEAIHFFEKTQEIEKTGGMWLERQNRRRTPGGIYFFLVKNDRHLPQGVIKTIFDDPRKRILEKQKKNMKKKKKKMERAQKNKELKKKLQDELNIISANVQNSKSSEGDSNPPPSPVSEEEEEKMESD
uniref:Phosphorylated adapter RNA export protein n=1 Tax=Cacopsylla melanoneura TaxID=428564 RepID=A0A8D8WEU4_9HEMI